MGTLFIFRDGISVARSFFCGKWKIMKHVFFGFSDNLLTENQSNIKESSLLRFSDVREISSDWVLKTLSGLIRLVSSAYKIASNNRLAFWISFIYMINKRGPSIEPYGTPVDTCTLSEDISSILTYCERLLK